MRGKALGLITVVTIVLLTTGIVIGEEINNGVFGYLSYNISPTNTSSTNQYIVTIGSSGVYKIELEGIGDNIIAVVHIANYTLVFNKEHEEYKVYLHKGVYIVSIKILNVFKGHHHDDGNNLKLHLKKVGQEMEEDD
ncbi:MAG: hypothetical protein OWQ54_09030 [Sulfolobaceae archaeon]|nr:hypothetical protein [Sulfolobaceae archaeon]